MLVCLLYIVSEKDLSFSLGERQIIDPEFEAQFGFLVPEEPLPIVKKIKSKEVAVATMASYATKERKERNVAVKTNAANNFHNIAFLLDADLADRHHVSPEFVRYKRTVCENYIKKYTAVARVEQEKFGIPVSITLAQGLLESDAGESRLARASVNHFGIKCFSGHCKKGHCKNFTDDTHKDFFVVYANAWQSFRAHSAFLKQNRYKELFKLKKNDYKGWAKGLKSAGYATDKKYDEKIIRLVEVLKLNKLD
jgi:flagellum-specific peptidoglycan hydrolase FlgJ